MTDRSFTDAIERGRSGFRYFEEFGPVYYKWTGATASVDLAARRAEQDDIDWAAINSTATVLTELVAGADSEIEAQVRQRDALAQAWTGEAGEEAVATLRRQVEQAEEGRTALDTAAAAWAQAAEAIRQVVADKSSVLVGFLETDESGEHTLLKIRNRTKEEIERFVDEARDDENYDETRETFTEWLDTVFRPDYETKTRTFLDACDGADDSVSQIYAALTESMQGFDASFPVPTQAAGPALESAIQTAAVSASTPASVSTAAAVPGVPALTESGPSTSPVTSGPSALTGLDPAVHTSTPAVSTGPVSTGLASTGLSSTQTGDGISGLIDLVARATETIGGVALGLVEGVVHLAESVPSDEPDAAERPAPDEAEPGNFELDGTPVTVAEGPEGELTISTSGPDAKSVDVTLDVDGVPIVVEDVGTDADPAETGIAQASPAVLPGAREEDAVEAAESNPESVQQPSPETVPEPLPEAVPEPVPEAVPEPLPEAVQQPLPEAPPLVAAVEPDVPADGEARAPGVRLEGAGSM